MVHVPTMELLRMNEAERAEVEWIAVHLASCPLCRALAASRLEVRATPGKRGTFLKPLLELARFEKDLAVEQLLARGEWADLRRLTSGAQKERVIRSRACHTSAFLDVLLAALRSPMASADAELLSNLAVLVTQGMDFQKEPPAFKNDLLATIWIDIANTRRRSGEWNHAQAALLRAEKLIEAGTGNPTVKAKWLSMFASLRCDQGERADAMIYLEQCRIIYEQRSDWACVARILVQMAHSALDDDPERGLAFLDKADVFIPLEETDLRWFSASLRTECLIALKRVDEACRAFEQAELLRRAQDRPNAKLRASFTAARLLEALGRVQEAATLFDEVVAGDLEQGLYKDAWLDLLYVAGFHVRAGFPDRAVAVSLRTLGEMEHQESFMHSQLRDVWGKLIQAARGEYLDERLLAQARQYLSTHWKYPASIEPAFGVHARQSTCRVEAAGAGDAKLAEPLIARAHWALIRREPRKEQYFRVARSPEYHTRAFVKLLLSEVRAADSREEAERVASLVLAVVQIMDEPAEVKHGWLAEVWIEVANICRICAEWSRAVAAFRRADEHLAQGNCDPLVKGRRLSVEASLRADQGHRSEAVAMLERCHQIYEDLKAWDLVSRTLVQMAHTLVDSEPERGLALVERALPLIPAADSVLRWLAESLRTECLIELQEIDQALQTFRLAESHRRSNPRADAARRSDFTAARLLEALGRWKDAERLFESVIADAFEHEAYREAFLDLLYLFGLHIRTGSTEKATALCRFAIARLELFDVGNEQLRKVWAELLDAAKRQAVSLEALAEARKLFMRRWAG